MPINEADVKLTYTTSNTPPASPDTNTIYFCNGSKTLWVGNTQYGLLELSKSATNSFTDGIDSLFKDVKASIQPVQAGSGTPSPTNVRAISGVTECTVLDISDSTNASYFMGLLTGTYGFIDLGALTWAKFSNYDHLFSASLTGIKTNTNNAICPTYSVRYISYANMADKSIRVENGSITLRNDAYDTTTQGIADLKTSLNGVYLIYELATPTTPTITDAQFQTLLTAFGYNGSTATISFGSAGTVYGGKVGITTGLLTVAYGSVDLGSLNWVYQSDTSRFYVASPSNLKRPSANSERINGICEVYNVRAYEVYGNYELAVTTMGSMFVKNSDYTDATAFKTAMSGKKLVYELATPVEYQLTPTQLRSLVGTNNLTSNTGDTVEVEYITNETIAWLLDNTVKN